MLVIRLARTGRHKYPVYRLVAADKRKAANGKFVSVLGHYNPHTKQLVMDKEQITKYMQNGAQPSNRVIKLLQAEKVEIPAWAVLRTKNRQPKKPESQTAGASDSQKPEPEKSESPTDRPSETPSVAESATEQEASVEANASDTGDVETATTEEAQADAASEAQETAAEVATEAAEEQA